MSTSVSPTGTKPSAPAPGPKSSGLGSFFTKTVFGGFLAVMAWAAQPQVLNVLPVKVSQIIMGIGVLLSVFGVRQAIAKNGTGN